MPSAAHEIRPTVVTVETGDRVGASLTINLEAHLAGIGAEHKDTQDAPEAKAYTALRALSPEELSARFAQISPAWLAGIEVIADGKPVGLSVTSVSVPAVGDVALARLSKVYLQGQAQPSPTAIAFRYAHAPGVILRVKPATGDLIEGGWLKPGQASAAVVLSGTAPQTSRLSRFVDYLVLGFTHIVPKGLDHILFVMGLYLLSSNWRTLLIQVTAFTVAHSLTLALGLMGIVEVSPKIVEPLIALSIAYVAIENFISSELKPWRPYLVFAFGLLHGLGFAEILRDAAIDGVELITALFGFNLGVELGQLAVIAMAWLAVTFWFGQKPWYRDRVVRPACVVIALFGCFWTIERLGII